MTHKRRLGVAGILCALVLVVGCIMAGLSAGIAYMSNPLGPWDHQSFDHIRLFSRIALILILLMAPVALLALSLRWLRLWWCVPVVIIGLAAWGRLTVFLPAG